MDNQRLSVLLEAYGADPRRWPAGEPASTDLSGSPLHDQAEEARRIDELLALAPSVVPSIAMRERILATAPGARPVRRLLDRWVWQAAAGAGLAASLAAGVFVGSVAQQPAADPNVQLALAAYSAPASAFGDLEIEEG